MHRSLVFASLTLLSTAVGCQAQPERRGLDETVSRIEEQLSRLEKSVAGQAQQAKEETAARDERSEEVDRLRRQLAELERSSRQTRTELEQELAQLRQRSEAAQREQEAKLREARDTDRKRAIEALADERRQIEKLREALAADLARDTRANDAGLRRENERLRQRVAELEREVAGKPEPRERRAPVSVPPAPAPAAPGSIVIHNEDGEVHLHFHGAAPDVTVTGKTPKHTPPPVPPRGVRNSDQPPAKREGGERDETSEKRLNHAPQAPVTGATQILSEPF